MSVENRATDSTAPEEQAVADAFFAWAAAELARRRQASQESLARARAGRDEARWQVAERAEARLQQLTAMTTTHPPYFARIRCRLAEESGEVVPLDVRVSNFPRSESFPVPPGPREMLDVSHLTALADLVRHPRQPTLTVSLTERQLLQAAGTGRLEVLDAVVEDVEWDGSRIRRTAPRFGAVFEDRVRRRLQGTASTSLDAMADVLDPEQSRILAQRDPRRRVMLLDGPAGTGKTVVAAHRIAVAAPADRPGLFVVPSATLAAYLTPALPRLGLAQAGTRVVTPEDLLALVAPAFLRWRIPDPQSAWPPDGVARIRSAGQKDPARFLAAQPDAFRHPAALLLLAVRGGARLPVPPAWVIVDEVQAMPAPALAALGDLAASDAWWVLAGDPLQADRDPFVWADAAKLLGPGRGAPQRMSLRQAYRLPPAIHGAAAALRQRLAPDAPASTSVRWHPVPGAVRRWPVSSPPAAVLADWLAMARRASPSGTMAVIVPDQMPSPDLASLGRAFDALGVVPERLTDDPVYRGGVVLAPLARLRGLEFDAVLIWDASGRAYPDTPEAGRRMYTALTRARRLAVALVSATDPMSPWVADWPVLESAATLGTS